MCNVNAPCYKCTARHENCHAHCRDYEIWKGDSRAEKLARKEYDEDLIFGHHTAAKDKYIADKAGSRL